MAYLGFARKYRPQNFEQVIGQEEIAQTLQNAIRQNRVHHAYIFAGSKGVGKTSMARIFSKALNCEQGPTPNPCNQCDFCTRISNGEDVDVVEIDGASNRGIEEIRNIKENVKYLMHGRYKVFIIDEVHMLTNAAFNALLKTLEEPPSHVKFILATTEINSIPETILSRCQRFYFKKMNITNIVKKLGDITQQESIEVDSSTLEEIALTAKGAMRDSLVLLDQLTAFAGNKISTQDLKNMMGSVGEESQQLIETIAEGNPDGLLKVIDEYLNTGGDPLDLVAKLLQQMRDLLVIKSTNKVNFIEGSENYIAWAQKISTKFSPEFLTMAIYHLLESKNLIHRSLMGRIVLETLLLKVLNSSSLVSVERLEQTIKNAELNVKHTSSSVVVEKKKTDKQPFIGQVPKSVVVGLTPTEKTEKEVDSQKLPETKILKTNTENTKQTKQATEVKQTTEVKQEPKQQTNQAKEVVSKTPSPTSTSVTEGGPWQQFLNELRKRFQHAAKLLETEAKFEIKDPNLVVTISRDYQFIAQSMLNKDNKVYVNQLLQTAFQKNIRLQFEFTGEEKKQTSQFEAKQQASFDPFVRKVMELFGGRVVDVRNY